MKRLLCFPFAVAAMLQGIMTAQAQTPCAFDKAVYRPVDTSELGALDRYALIHHRKAVGPNQSQLAMTISAEARESGGKGQSHDFSFAFSNGYGRSFISLAPGAGKMPSKRRENVTSVILYFDAAMRKTEPHSDTTGAAPAYLVMPDIGKALWYADRPFNRSFVPSDGLWKLAECRA